MKILLLVVLLSVALGFPQRLPSGKYRGSYPYPRIQSRKDASNFRVYSIQDPPPPPLDIDNNIEEPAESESYSPPAPTQAPYIPPAKTEAPKSYPLPTSYKSPAPEPYREEEPVPGMPYSFSWEVSDKESGNEFGQDEESDGSNTKGSYKVLLPDGRTQKVTYKVKPGAGYTAEIAYEGEAIFPESSPTPYKAPKKPSPYEAPVEEDGEPKDAPTEEPKEAFELLYDPDSDAAMNRFTFVEQPRSLFK